MTASPHSVITGFATHECLITGRRTMDLLGKVLGCRHLTTLYGSDRVADDDVLIVATQLPQPRYLRLLPKVPKLNRKDDLALYAFASRFGWQRGAGGLLVVNTTMLDPKSGQFREQDKVVQALANIVNYQSTEDRRREAYFSERRFYFAH